MDEREKYQKKKKYSKISGSGRLVTLPKRLMTTSSSDETLKRQKKSQGSKCMKTEFDRLRLIMHERNNTEKKQKLANTSEKATIPSTSEKMRNAPTPTCVHSQVDTSNSETQPFEPPEFVACTKSTIATSPVSPTSRQDTAGEEMRCTCKNQEILDQLTQVDTFDSETQPFEPPESVACAKSTIATSSVSRTSRRDTAGEEMRCTCKNQEILDQLTNLENQSKTIIAGHEQLMRQIKEMQAEVQIRGEVNVTKTFYEPLEGFPLKTVEEFEEMESDIKRNERKKLYHHLRVLGGTKLREFIHSSLKEVMTDELVCKFTWPGGSGTEKFKDTKILNILYMAAQKCPFFSGPDNKTVFKADVQEVLRSVKQRFRKKIKNEEKKREKQGHESDKSDYHASNYSSVETEYETDS
ncbi:uncharacterized protein [Linepithema humile]|uniref:uncharacterized protein isoform X2 n=1 Tax=Linepithema humile TaxID=83485 RepID=UPI00351EB073